MKSKAQPTTNGVVAVRQNISCLLYGPGDARYEEHPLPTLTDPYDVLVRIQFVGVCGSDVHFWCHGGVGKNVVSHSKPLVMGHEASGIIDQVGPAVSTLKAGDRVAIEPGYPCRRCETCKRGQYNLCLSMKFAACPPDDHGTLTRLFKVPADFCYQLPNRVSLEEGVLVEPLAVAAHAARVANVRHGDNVVIFGSGTIGLLCAAVARAFGAKKVVAVDILEHKLQFAQNLNHSDIFLPDRTMSPEENANQLIKNSQLGLGADVVMEASGAPSSISTGVHVLRPGGIFVQVGVVGRKVEFPIQTVCEKELHVRGSHRYGPGDYQTALDMLTSKTTDFESLISTIVPFEKATDAWEMTRNGQGIKNLIRGPGV